MDWFICRYVRNTRLVKLKTDFWVPRVHFFFHSVILRCKDNECDRHGKFDLCRWWVTHFCNHVKVELRQIGYELCLNGKAIECTSQSWTESGTKVPAEAKRLEDTEGDWWRSKACSWGWCCVAIHCAKVVPLDSGWRRWHLWPRLTRTS